MSYTQYYKQLNIIWFDNIILVVKLIVDDNIQQYYEQNRIARDGHDFDFKIIWNFNDFDFKAHSKSKSFYEILL